MQDMEDEDDESEEENEEGESGSGQDASNNFQGRHGEDDDKIPAMFRGRRSV
jgi:hypothetical protein